MIIADLHIHSHFSRATSKRLDFPNLAKWAQLKGVNLLGTGDIAHPGWLKEMRENLEPAGGDLFRLKPEIAAGVRGEIPSACQSDVRFMLAGEISNIYKRHDAVRKVHNVVFAPTLDAVEQIQLRLEKIGNIRSDGRPILGLDSRDLLEIILDVDERCHLIPAHIWTPWFSMLGSKSGFDTVEQCFGDLTDHIFAVETGLSSDPPMNWRVSMLDRYTLVSHSDAHSPQKLAREATLYDTEWRYDAIFDALKSGDPAHYKGTLEFFPEEGKYHMDGHRKCGVCWHPQTTVAHDGRCSECGKPVTVGVMHRVEELADRPLNGTPTQTHPFHSLIPLPEIISELVGVGVNTKTVRTEHMRLLTQLGNELDILLTLPLDEIAQVGGEQLAAGIGRMRQGNVDAQGGFDGEYGVVRLFTEAVIDGGQLDLFEGKNESEGAGETAASSAGSNSTNGPKSSNLVLNESVPLVPHDSPVPPSTPSLTLNAAQQSAVETVERSLVIMAGPGTGKTRTVTVRMAHLMQNEEVDPRSMLAITFTNKAAGELAERLVGLVGEKRADQATVATFHGFGAQILQQWGTKEDLPQDFAILGEDEQTRLLRQVCPELSAREAAQRLAQISRAKNQLLTPEIAYLHEKLSVDEDFTGVYRRYQAGLRATNALDFDDLILETVTLLELHPLVLMTVQERYRWITVDEYQDVNFAQYRLLRLLTQGGANLCVIGDPDQAIYSFRGADQRYFQNFLEDYPGAKQIRLSQSYRSSQTILQAAGQVIAQNPEREALDVWSDFADRVKLTVHGAPTDKAEAEYVVHRIEEMVGGTSYFSIDSGRVSDDTVPISRSFGDFAVLYRLNAQASLLMEAFDRSGIPYQCAGQTPFFARPGVRRYLAYLWTVAAPHSRLHWQSVLSKGDGTFSDALDGLTESLVSGEKGRGDLLTDGAYLSGIDGETARRLQALAAFWARLGGDAEGERESDVPDESEESKRAEASVNAPSIKDLLQQIHVFVQEWDETPLGQRDLDYLLARADEYGDRLMPFLRATALHSEADAYDPRADRVSLMSLHASKGLEFAAVFVVGCEEGLLPYLPEKTDDPGLAAEEERRLFYVGMTRAERQLILTHAQRRLLFGQTIEPEPSRFLADIESALKAVSQVRATPRKPETVMEENVQLTLF